MVVLPSRPVSGWSRSRESVSRPAAGGSAAATRARSSPVGGRRVRRFFSEAAWARDVGDPREQGRLGDFDIDFIRRILVKDGPGRDLTAFFDGRRRMVHPG